MTVFNDIKLDNIDPEDFEDTLLKLEKSFGLKFADSSFKDAKTFGDICDIIEGRLNLIHTDDCTAQQAFYKVRNAICLTQTFDATNIELGTSLENVFPRLNRKKNVAHFQQALGFPVNILTMKAWLFLVIVAGFVGSLVAFFFSWLYAVSGLILFTLFSWIASKFSKELNVSTVKELTEKITREHYLSARRQRGTMNRNEIVKIIQDTFIADHFLDQESLTRDAALGWK
ncbi:hypothetical protein QEG73_05075 [Chitinophagaceae bacterium 26-R-25]|nr:hypothetical protein [Chitinophagaceae bacterium 26-R-25]